MAYSEEESGSLASPGARESVTEILQRYAGASSVHPIVADRAVFDAALLAGKSVLETAPESPASKAIGQLVNDLCGVK